MRVLLGVLAMGLMAGLIFWGLSRGSTETSQNIVEEHPAVLDSETTAVPASRGSEYGVSSDLIDALNECFDSEVRMESGRDGSDQEADLEPVRLLSLDDFRGELEKEIGPALQQGDLWTEWIVRLRGGLDRKIHLENIVGMDGSIRRRLRVFQLDQSGNSQPLKVEGVESGNPSMQVISALLNEGEVLRKESARYFQYANGERLEVVEVNSIPVELEIVRGEIFFRCDDLKSSDACTCVR